MLADCVSELGFEVQTAASGREAIDLGAGLRPDVLLSDWMLKGSIHGLHVSEILRIVDPGLRTILITGYASDDLEEEARRARISGFIEKPFDRTTLQAAVQQAAEKTDPERRMFSFPVIEVDPDLTITYVNSDAEQLLDKALQGGERTPLDRLLRIDRSTLARSVTSWSSVEPTDSGGHPWHIRAKPLPNSERMMLVLVEKSDYGYFRKHPHLQNFLGEQDAALHRNHIQGNVLIVDDKPMIRSSVASAFEKLGSISHTADNYEDAIRLFHRDRDVSFLVVNADLKGNFAGFIRDVKAERPLATVVAASSGNRRDEFAAMGIHRYLVYPWSIDDLLMLLPNRVGRCVRCDVPLPLLNPVVGGDVRRWKCANCGYVYRAIFDDDAPQLQRDNAVPF